MKEFKDNTKAMIELADEIFKDMTLEAEHKKLNKMKEEHKNNWYSRTKEWNPIQSQEVIEQMMAARKLRNNGVSVKEIAEELNLSVSRIYEYLRKS